MAHVGCIHWSIRSKREKFKYLSAFKFPAKHSLTCILFVKVLFRQNIASEDQMIHFLYWHPNKFSITSQNSGLLSLSSAHSWRNPNFRSLKLGEKLIAKSQTEALQFSTLYTTLWWSFSFIVLGGLDLDTHIGSVNSGC